MPWSERFVRDRKRQLDCVLHHACTQLAPDPPALKAFHQLLTCTRQRSPRLLEAPVVAGRHPGTDALVNLARFHHARIRSVLHWPGTLSSWRPAVASLAQHLVGRYPVPTFLASAWSTTSDTAAQHRHWYIAHANGASFRSLDLPLAMTRRMEHIFLASHHHLSLEQALRRAELLALGAPSFITTAILSSRLATDLHDSTFWRSIWHFLIANQRDLDPAHIAPLLDYLHAVRRNQVPVDAPAPAIDTHAPAVGFNAPQPAFSIRGRTVNSMLRLMRDWHRSLATGTAAFSWPPSPLQPLHLHEPPQDESDPPLHWQLIELTNSTQLRIEGAALHHCVASYAHLCQRGDSRIWSLRLRRGDKLRHLLTLEVDPARHAIVQLRGYANRSPSGKPLRLVHQWAERERLRIAP